MARRRILYVSHPEVVIDPAVPVPEWGLSEVGAARIRTALSTGWPGPGWQIITSPEVKAQETAGLIAEAFDLPIMIHPDMGEVDRSSTGYLPHDQHEAHANALFTNLLIGPNGWESAQEAQRRIVKAFEDVTRDVSGDLMLVGHGAVGSFLWCHLSAQTISRQQDQPCGGCLWQVDQSDAGFVPVHGWRSVEDCAG